MLPSNSLMQTLKQAAIEAVEASKPCAIVFGTVKSTSPLSISIDQKLTLASPFLVATQSAKDNLSAGDRVALVRVQGGQQYLVIDKVVSA